MTPLSFATNFAAHRHLLATDNDYRRRHGLPPLADDEVPVYHDDDLGDLAGIDPSLVVKVDAMKQEKKQLAKQIKRLEVQIAEAEEILIAQFEAAGINDLTINNRRATPQSLLWAAKVNEEVTTSEICDALEAAGLPWFVERGYKYQSVSSWMRELEEQRKPLPPEVAKVLTGNVKWHVGFTQVRRTRTQRRLAGERSSILDGSPDGASDN
jgi:hypothetical protein